MLRGVRVLLPNPRAERLHSLYKVYTNDDATFYHICSPYIGPLIHYTNFPSNHQAPDDHANEHWNGVILCKLDSSDKDTLL
jgi:hypothetical protein